MIMAKKIIELTNEKGYLKRYLVNEEDVSEAEEIGLDVGVPDLDQLDWEAMKVELSNQLYRSGLFTIQDIRAKESGISSALRFVFLRKITDLYKE